MKYFVFTLGCQMNISDSERISTKLNQLGYKSASEKEADLIIINACSVRQKAVDRIWGGIKKWKKVGKKVIVTGCVLPSDRKKLNDRSIEYKDFYDDHFFDLIPESTSKIAYIPIMTGCNNFCSYCAVPYTRGREKSRPLKDVISDVKRAIAAGKKEIMLLGQNVNSYANNFSRLLRQIDDLEGDFTFTFMSSNPHDMTKDIIDTFATLKKWPHELHLPLQSGDDEILKKMNRKYSSSQYLALVRKLRYAISDLRLTTDIIVGFPGETKTQFNNTVKLCKKVSFSKVYIGQYSPRPGTVSAKMTDDVSEEEKKRRWLILEKLINKKS